MSRILFRSLVSLAVTCLAGNILADPGGKRLTGESMSLGDGSVHAYVELDKDALPSAVGVSFTAAMLNGLPAKPNKTSRCFDLDGDGEIADMGECDGDEERILWLPQDYPTVERLPFKYIMLNWNPMGHGLPAPPPWLLPHFDFHFYMQDYAEVDSMGTGPCGIFLDCEAFEHASKPVPAKYVHPDHIDVGASVPRMGNHLIDSRSPELIDPSRAFTHTSIIGSYNGSVTFWEPMITHDFITSRQNVCIPIRQPEAWETAGYYPTVYCIKYSEDDNSHTISLEKLVYREAS
jgi:hypothetical protein